LYTQERFAPKNLWQRVADALNNEKITQTELVALKAEIDGKSVEIESLDARAVAGHRFAEAMVKELTGGDRVRARRMREDFWEFAPTHHLWIAGNQKPAVRGADEGIWRRIKLIPFDVVIPKEERDVKLKEKLAAELPGILNWAIAGCLDWQRNGMQEPKIVSGATEGCQPSRRH
jgi:P4 family phage/plasmid primase-like protien